MSWSTFWAPNLVSWVLGGAITAIVGMYLRRIARKRQAEVDRLLNIAERLLGAPVPDREQEPSMPNLAAYRKGVAVILGVLLTALLTWASSAGPVEQLLAPLLPSSLRPLAGVLAGGVATAAGVILARNGDAPQDRAATLPASPSSIDSAGEGDVVAAVASPPVSLTTAATTPQPAAAAPFWAAVRPGEPQAATAIVDLLPPPGGSYQ